MTPTDIRILLLQRGLSQAGIAREWNVSRSFVNDLVAGRKASPERRKQFAARLGLTEEEIWGDTNTSGGGGSRSAPSQSEADSVNMSTGAPAQGAA